MVTSINWLPASIELQSRSFVSPELKPQLLIPENISKGTITSKFLVQAEDQAALTNMSRLMRQIHRKITKNNATEEGSMSRHSINYKGYFIFFYSSWKLYYRTFFLKEKINYDYISKAATSGNYKKCMENLSFM